MIIDQIYTAGRIRRKPGEGETPSRSILKALSWRCLGTLDTILISWMISGKLSIAFSIGLVELVTKTAFYYLHERAWNKIKWGK